MNIYENPHAAWMETAKKISDTYLCAHPSTEDVMSFFSEDAIFVEEGRYNIGKSLATMGFKFSCEYDINEIRLLNDPKFEEQSDHILWSFNSIQWRGLLPEVIKKSNCYEIECTFKLYFNDANLISGIETIKNIWIEV